MPAARCSRSISSCSRQRSRSPRRDAPRERACRSRSTSRCSRASSIGRPGVPSPVWLQRLALAPLAWLARRRGYDSRYVCSGGFSSRASLPAPARSSSPLHWATTNDGFLSLNLAVNRPLEAAVSVSELQLGLDSSRNETTICSPPSGGESLPTTLTLLVLAAVAFRFASESVRLDRFPACPPLLVAKPVDPASPRSMSSGAISCGCHVFPPLMVRSA